jgi:hypothetical protein
MKTPFVFKALSFILAAFVGSSLGFAQKQPDEISSSHLLSSHPQYASQMPHGSRRGFAGANNLLNGNSGIPGIDSLVNWNGDFHAKGVDQNGAPRDFWLYTMIGNPPEKGGTTRVKAPIVPVTVVLLDYDGSVRMVNGVPMVSSPAPFISPTANSPVFKNNIFSTSDVPTQVTDAVQRAEFYNRMRWDWHTLLQGQVKRGRTMAIPRGSYFFSRNADGTCCRYILADIDVFSNLLFPATPTDTTTPVGAAEHSGDITTKDLSTFLFPNTYLYFNNDPNQCCVLGYHSYDSEPGNAENGNLEKRYVLNYSSWISEGLFGGGFADITALSHEVAESFNDPFVASDGIHNITPWWLSPNGNCQDNLEDGDVIEGLPNDVFPIKMSGRTYHPQNEALLQWFEFKSPSDAFAGAYSYPDTTTLTTLSPFEGVNCQ